MEITKELLESYRSKKDEIRELRYTLDHLGDDDSMIGNDTIFDYSTGYPRPQSVIGFDQKKYNRMRGQYQSRMQQLQEECAAVELWIEEIPDSLTRRIFRMYYVEGRKQRQISRAVHLDRSSVSKKIDAFLKTFT